MRCEQLHKISFCFLDGPENSLILLSGAAGAFARQDMLQTTPKKELANLGYPNGPLLI